MSTLTDALAHPARGQAKTSVTLDKVHSQALLARPRITRILGRRQHGEVAAAPWIHSPTDPYRCAYLTRTSRIWAAGLGQLDDHPITCEERRCALNLGITLDIFRMGTALLLRAPETLQALWGGEEHRTRTAYALLLALECSGPTWQTTSRGRA